ncbi:hypothetical protein H7H73_27650, partial [Mycobacterium rufum]|nr:hypothetical protein [Mycolicibacterium rufum]
MGPVLGLSLTATEVVWALVDETARTVADHDAVEWDADSAIAEAAARGAHALARACGLEVDRVRLVWTPDARDDGMRLRAHLDSHGIDTEAVPLTCATRVLVDPGQSDMPPLVAWPTERHWPGRALRGDSPSRCRAQTPARRRRATRVVAAAL